MSSGAESIAERIAREVLRWPETSSQPHRFGGVEFRYAGHELGHLHGNQQADLPFPVRVREELVASGRASPHHILPQTGWVTCYIHGEDDLADDLAHIVALFRLNYDRIASAMAMYGSAQPHEMEP
jgi:luciferase-like monooxygenase